MTEKGKSGVEPPKSFYIKLHTTAMCADWQYFLIMLVKMFCGKMVTQGDGKLKTTFIYCRSHFAQSLWNILPTKVKANYNNF